MQNQVPVVALVGYTNSGKSTLLNRLTGAGILAEDKLFATLDPTTRKLTLTSGSEVRRHPPLIYLQHDAALLYVKLLFRSCVQFMCCSASAASPLNPFLEFFLFWLFIKGFYIFVFFLSGGTSPSCCTRLAFSLQLVHCDCDCE